jgi:hypothetical protein
MIFIAGDQNFNILKNRFKKIYLKKKKKKIHFFKAETNEPYIKGEE